jgi:O-succinylbenzoate synthase
MFSFQIFPYTLHFLFEAGTSRGVLREKKSWFIRLTHSDFPGIEGWGECGPLPGLSPENLDTFPNEIKALGDFLMPKLETSPRLWET